MFIWLLLLDWMAFAFRVEVVRVGVVLCNLRCLGVV